VETLQKCLLLPIDGSEECLRPVSFLKRLYPDLRNISVILFYLRPPLSPFYQEKADSVPLLEKRKELFAARERNSRAIFENARRHLIRAGFSDETVQECAEEKQSSAGRHACLLADIRQVDAVLVQKRVSSSLEGFLRGDPTSDLLRHCLASPIWFTEGQVDPERAAICVLNEDASLRIADHAAFMLADTTVEITLLHASRTVPRMISAHPAGVMGEELGSWLKTPAGQVIEPFLAESRQILRTAGIDESRVRVTLIPDKGNTAMEILSHCREQGIGIVALGHSEPAGTWGFFKNSVTRKVLSEFKNMAVWVNQ